MPRRSSKENGKENRIEVSGVMTCERCGEPISWISIKKRESGEGFRYYYYAVHYYGVKNGKKNQKECYLGPVGKYEYVDRINPLGLKSAKEQDRFEEYMERILNSLLVKDHFSTDKAIKLIDELMNLVIRKVESEEEKRQITDELKKWAEKLEGAK